GLYRLPGKQPSSNRKASGRSMAKNGLSVHTAGHDHHCGAHQLHADQARGSGQQGLHRHFAGRGLFHAESTGAERGHAQQMGSVGNGAGAQPGGAGPGTGCTDSHGEPAQCAALQSNALALEQVLSMTSAKTGNTSIWMVGDLQGCCAPLQALMAHPDIVNDTNARFWFAGDLINRGPDSLGTLRAVMALQDRASVVLGNHDLHLLAIATGIKKPGKSDTIHDILNAPDAQELLSWLRHRPLAHYEQGHLMVHAGVLPAWDLEKTLALAGEAQA